MWLPPKHRVTHGLTFEDGVFVQGEGNGSPESWLLPRGRKERQSCAQVQCSAEQTWSVCPEGGVLPLQRTQHLLGGPPSQLTAPWRAVGPAWLAGIISLMEANTQRMLRVGRDFPSSSSLTPCTQ